MRILTRIFEALSPKAKAENKQQEFLNLSAAALTEVARDGTLNALHRVTFEHNDNPGFPALIGNVVDIIAERDAGDALGTAWWAMAYAKVGKDIIGEKILGLIDQNKSATPRLTPTFAMAAQCVANRAVAGSDLERRAMREWHLAVTNLKRDALADQDLNLGFAIAATCNAALDQQKSTISAAGIEQWTDLVNRLSQADPVAAEEEARRVLTQYHAFTGEVGDNFRNRAIAILPPLQEKIQQFRPDQAP